MEYFDSKSDSRGKRAGKDEARKRISNAKQQNSQVLDISDLDLDELPESICELSCLDTIYAYKNRLTRLPDSFGYLKGLKNLRLDRNRFTHIPSQISELTNLQYLDLDGNSICHFSDTLKGLNGLVILSLNRNSIREIPNWIDALSSLETLSIENNQIAALPTTLSGLICLTDLRLAGNPLRYPTQRVLYDSRDSAKTAKSWLAYQKPFKQMTTNNRSKMMVIGHPYAGKTSLLNYLIDDKKCDDTEDEEQKKQNQTRGFEVRSYKPNSDSLILDTWDFGGQQFYQAAHQFFLTDHTLYLLVWDPRWGFELSNTPDWLQRVANRAPNAPVILVSTRRDETNTAHIPSYIFNQFPQICGNEHVSSLTGEGCDELVKVIKSAINDPDMMPHIREPWPPVFHNALDRLYDLKDQHLYMKEDEVRRVINDCGLNDRHTETELLLTFHRLGVILYYGNDGGASTTNRILNDYVILDPTYIGRRIAKILDSDDVVNNGGVLTKVEEYKLWDSLKQEQETRKEDSTVDAKFNEFFLRLIEEFNVSYRIPNDQQARSIVVERLNDEVPGYSSMWESKLGTRGCKECGMVWNFHGPIPPGIPTWLMARCHRFAHDNPKNALSHHHWRYGSLLTDADGKHLALLLSNPHKNEVSLDVRGPAPYDFFKLLCDGFEFTLSRYKGLELSRYFRCPRTQNHNCKSLFDKDDVILSMPSMTETMQCHTSKEQIPLREFPAGGDAAPYRKKDNKTEETYARDFPYYTEVTDELFNMYINPLLGTDDQGNNAQAVYRFLTREYLNMYRYAQLTHNTRSPVVFSISSPHEYGSLLEGDEGYLDGNIQLYCHEPGHWHPVGPEIQLPIETIESGPFVSLASHLYQVVKGLSKLLPMLANREKSRVSELCEAFKESNLDAVLSGDSGIHKIDKLSVTSGMQTRRNSMTYLRNRLHLACKRQGIQVSNNRIGDLFFAETPEGHRMWLCKDHLTEYKLLS